MSQPFVGQILLVGFNFAPAGWMTCSGQTLLISDNPTLFQLIGTTYGGDGQQNFMLPDLRGRVVVGIGQGPGLQAYTIGEQGGVEGVSLTPNQLPDHTHQLMGSTTGSAADPGSAVMPGTTPSAIPTYSPITAGTPVQMSAVSLDGAGSDVPHDNRQPYLTMNYIISLLGIFPSQS